MPGAQLGIAGQRLLATGVELAGTGAEFAAIAEGVVAAAEAAKNATDWMLAAPALNDRAAGGTPYLRLMSLALGARYLGRGALAARGTVDADSHDLLFDLRANDSIVQCFDLVSGVRALDRSCSGYA